jgi:protein ImuA
MSPGGSSERISFLRAAIARIEAGQPPGAAASGCGELSEVVPASVADRAAACGFALTLATRAAGAQGIILWVAEDFVLAEAGLPYGPGLAEQGIDPGRLVLVRAATARQALWALEEALKSSSCTVAVGEVVDAARHCDLALTRRLVVAARASGAQGILLHGRPAAGDLSTAAQTRFEVHSRSGVLLTSAGARRPIPDQSAWGVRVLKARAAQGLSRASDPERVEVFTGGAPIPGPGPSPTLLPAPRRMTR